MSNASTRSLNSSRSLPPQSVTLRLWEKTHSFMDVVSAISGLRGFLEIERRRVPGEVLSEVDRLEYLFFAGYDPHFEGDEPGPLA
jgi:hypothetical protein